jgi:hypothetical protein
MFWSLRAIDKVPCMHGRWTKYVGGVNLPLKDVRQQKKGRRFVCPNTSDSILRMRNEAMRER